MTMELTVNGRKHVVPQASPNESLLWVLREDLALVGTKFGCGQGVCGACTVHVNGVATRACITPCATVANAQVTTIEGLEIDGQLHAVQRAWLELRVAQCGYCQTGQMMSAAALLLTTPAPNDSQIDEAMSANLCRCGTYVRIRAAVHRASALLGHNKTNVKAPAVVAPTVKVQA